MEYAIWVVSPDNNIHSRCFEEVALCLQEALQQMGHRCDVIKAPEFHHDVIIVLGGHLLDRNWHYSGTAKFIFYNLEQSERLTGAYTDILRRHVVWDYSMTNIAALEKLGIKAGYCEIGYMSALTKIDNLPPQNQDIEVLFYGSVNKYRKKILEDLLKNGIKTVSLFGVYGTLRDDFIARSKIILNMHFYEGKLFELVRCSYVMANRKCIVSEFGQEPELEQKYYKAIAFADYDNLIDKITHLLADDALRTSFEKQAFDVFSQRSQVDILRNIL